VLDALLVAELDRRRDVGVRHLGGPDLDHVDAVGVAGQNEVQIGELHLGVRGVQHELLALLGHQPADANRGHGALERSIAQAQGRRPGAARQHVGVVLAVVAHDPHLDLDLIDEAVGKERADGAIDHPHGEDFLLVRRPLALAEASGELTARPELLAVITLKGEVVQPRTRIGPYCRGQNRGVRVGRDHRPVGQPGDLAGLEPEGTAADLSLNELKCHRNLSSLWECARAATLRGVPARPPTPQEAEGRQQTTGSAVACLLPPVAGQAASHQPQTTAPYLRRPSRLINAW